MADLPNNSSTTATLTVDGPEFTSTLSSGADRDWVRIDLDPGEWVAVTQRGTGATPLDAYMSVYDADGNFVTTDDESDASNTDFNATVIFGGGAGGTFYVEAGSYFNGSSGSYTLEAVSVPEPSGTPLDVLDSGSLRTDAASPITVYFVPDGQTRDGVTSEGWSESERAQFMAALGAVEAVANITFEESSNANADFQLVLDTNELVNDPNGGEGLLGYFFLPFRDFSSVGVFNGAGFGWTPEGLQAGGLGYSTIIHEVLHGLGLEHPHADTPADSAFPGVDVSFYDFGVNGLGQGVNTIMSYNSGWGGAPGATNFNYGDSATPMALDIAMLQQLYGANTTHNNGNNTYALDSSNSAGTGWMSIWDTGGIDTIAYSGSRDTIIDLRPATLDYGPGGGGFISNASGIQGGFTIANGVMIENATSGSGDDTLVGNDGNNVLTGNGGNDLLIGGAGRDTLNGGAGTDEINGDAGNDNISGGTGNDTVDAGGNNDLVDGNSGNDTISSSSGTNTIYGSSGNDQITGGTGADTIYGGSGNDVIAGGGGNDALFGGRGNDEIDGGSGTDEITGGLGQDLMRGGSGADTFIFNAISDSWNNNRDNITDFETGTDDIDLRMIDADLSLGGDQAFTFNAGGAPTNSAGEIWATVSGGDTIIFVDQDGDGNADMGITLAGTTGVTAGDFIL
ncbi:M10 family metallopeptidase [Yoonia algicola]|uniref:M10 family metallopeptidase n=1 Tax=Yoonia algicola TaxID=3137368 RepID=A0AAN0M872_9RHOB